MKPEASLSSEENCALFAAVAPRYDLLNHLLSLGLHKRWRRIAVARLAPGEGRYLDVGCGTGDSAREIARQALTARVTGIDPCEEMLAVGREKIRAAGLEASIELRKGDILTSAFAPACFAGALCAFSIRNVTDRKQVLEELFRVLAPGGKLVLLELTEPPGRIARGLFRVYERRVIPLLARLSHPAAYRYLTASIAAFPPPEVVLGELREAGFHRRGYEPMSGGVVSLFWGETAASPNPVVN
jgi:demethylmenaquinone methyltransferase / 2-methoxy-6-polyprenyl-1,4-benzoquinol methylase